MHVTSAGGLNRPNLGRENDIGLPLRSPHGAQLIIDVLLFSRAIVMLSYRHSERLADLTTKPLSTYQAHVAVLLQYYRFYTSIYKSSDPLQSLLCSARYRTE